MATNFHPECFACAYCNKIFANSPFYLEDGLPYCEEGKPESSLEEFVKVKFVKWKKFDETKLWGSKHEVLLNLNEPKVEDKTSFRVASNIKLGPTMECLGLSFQQREWLAKPNWRENPRTRLTDTDMTGLGQLLQIGTSWSLIWNHVLLGCPDIETSW